MNLASIAVVVLLLGVLTLVSYVERLYSEMGKFLSREFEENVEFFEHQVEPRLKVSHERAALSFSVLAPLTVAALSLLIGGLVFQDRGWTRSEIAQAAISLVLIVIVFNR